jgi:hypothetical protein
MLQGTGASMVIVSLSISTFSNSRAEVQRLKKENKKQRSKHGNRTEAVSTILLLWTSKHKFTYMYHNYIVGCSKLQSFQQVPSFITAFSEH